MSFIEAKEYVNNGEYRQAIKIYDEILEKTPNDISALKMKGVVQINQGQYTKALEQFYRTLQFVPNDALALTGMGVGFGYLGEFQESKSYFVKAENEKPNDVIIKNYNEFVDKVITKYPYTPTEKPASYQSYLDKMEDMTNSEQVDVMLMSMTSAEILVNKGIFKDSPVTPAVRMNDTSCIWGMIRNGDYFKEQSRPFATTQLRHAINYVDLGLYSITFNKSVDRDIEMLNQYRNFRDNAEQINMRHFLEVFNSAVINLSIVEMGEYINDCILKTLAGQISKEKPLI